MKKAIFPLVLAIFFIVGQTEGVLAWSEHPMVVFPVLKSTPAVMNAGPVEVKSLHRFLMEEEEGLQDLLSRQEDWARENIPSYAPRPDALAFTAGGNPEDVLNRFYAAIRINPNVKMALYLHLLPGQQAGDREQVDPRELTTLSTLYEMLFTTYVRLEEGEMIRPVDVLSTATDEPDYGFDLGLFTDNGTAWGQIYGFGEQPFGNPGLEYGSQAPFHMGFYHESWLVFAAAPFLKRTFVEYRIHLYKTLSLYAFEAGQDYWGWRFMGWAMHYLNDMSMPYHTTVMPAKRPLAMIWINLKAILGFPRSRDNAVQLLSNRHTVYEQFQWQILRRAHLENDLQHPFLRALTDPLDMVEYDNDFPRKIAARESNRAARRNDRLLRRNIPRYLVSDPKHEIAGSHELDDLLDLIVEEKGMNAVDELTDMIAERFRALSMHTHSFVQYMLTQKSYMPAQKSDVN
jgi:hypothetical protein